MHCFAVFVMFRHPIRRFQGIIRMLLRKPTTLLNPNAQSPIMRQIARSETCIHVLLDASSHRYQGIFTTTIL